MIQGKNAVSEFLREFKKAARQGPVLFFAPLMGFIRGIRFQWRTMKKIDHDDAH